MISERLRFAVKTSQHRQYQLAQAIGVHRCTLSCWLNGIVDVRSHDARVLKLGEILGVPAGECFKESTAATKADGADVQAVIST